MLDLASSTGSARESRIFSAGLDALVVVVDGDGQRPLGGVLPDDVALEEFADLGGLGQFVEFDVVGVGEFLFDDLVAQVDALVADVDAGARNELLDLLLALSAERALQQVTAVSDARHGAGVLLPVRRRSSIVLVGQHSGSSPTLPACSGHGATDKAESRRWYSAVLREHIA